PKSFVSRIKFAMQTFLSAPKFNKKYVYSNPENTYQHFVNAYAFYKMASTGILDANKSELCKERRDPIHEKPVNAEYIDKESNLCDEVEFTTSEKTNEPSLKENDSS
ncbi:34373_t:CDS:2, partial [Racocetra persica]